MKNKFFLLSILVVLTSCGSRNSSSLSSVSTSLNQSSISSSNENSVSSSSLVMNTTSSKKEEKLQTRIIACSDFQAKTGNFASQENMMEILEVMEDDGIDEADAFFCCGDYDYEYSDTEEGISALVDLMSGYVLEDNMIFVQGNHDEIESGTGGLSLSGNNDPLDGEYGVFVINEDDYMWYNDKEDVVKNTANQLKIYLDEKIKEEYSKPIFVLSHLSLHYSMRTYYDGDGMYAKYIYDEIDKAALNGLNIIFMYGHNHSNGWDDYLGGASVFLNKGDSILISDGTKYKYETYTLNFTYMNAGYVGYYGYVNEGADSTLTMSVIDIYESKVEFNRYSKDGLHNLKSEGVRNSFKSEFQYEPNLTIYPSPQIITLS